MRQIFSNYVNPRVDLSYRERIDTATLPELMPYSFRNMPNKLIDTLAASLDQSPVSNSTSRALGRATRTGATRARWPKKCNPRTNVPEISGKQYCRDAETTTESCGEGSKDVATCLVDQIRLKVDDFALKQRLENRMTKRLDKRPPMSRSRKCQPHDVDAVYLLSRLMNGSGCRPGL